MPHPLDPDGALFELLRPRLTALSRRIVGSTAEAEDIVQDCFFKWHGAAQEALATPAAWLTTVVQHRSIDSLRKRARDAVAAHDAIDDTASAAQPDEVLLQRADLGAALTRMHSRLSRAERMALVLHEVFEWDHAAIAAALGTTPVNARQYLARAPRRLRDDSVAAPEEKLCRDLIRRFQAAIHGLDMPALLSLLADEQPVSVHAAPPAACANDSVYAQARAA